MRCLIIEDEKKLADLIASRLNAEDLLADVAYDGNTGWEFACQRAYDFIILDHALPGISGTDFLAQFREKGLTTPVLVLSASDSTSDKVRHLAAGADDYLTKPFALAELLVRAKALLPHGVSNTASLLRIGDLEMDRVSHQVKRAGRPIALSSQEYVLLEYLLTHSGRVLSCDMILEHAWDKSFHGFPDLVSTYVRHLSEKIDSQHSEKLIQTVPGLGYCLGGKQDQ